jgi:hypothetical protein
LNGRNGIREWRFDVLDGHCAQTFVEALVEIHACRNPSVLGMRLELVQRTNVHPVSKRKHAPVVVHQLPETWVVDGFQKRDSLFVHGAAAAKEGKRCRRRVITAQCPDEFFDAAVFRFVPRSSGSNFFVGMREHVCVSLFVEDVHLLVHESVHFLEFSFHKLRGDIIVNT